MNRVDVENLSRADDCGNVQIALCGRRGPNAGGFVSEANVQRVAVDVAVDGHRADAHLFAGPDDAAGNLSPIGNQDFAEASRSVHNIADLQLPIGDLFLQPASRIKSAIGNWK